MRVGLALAALALAAACHDAPTAPTAPVRVDLSRGWLRASPGEVGMSAPGLLGAAGDASGIPRFRSLLVARHGRLVAEDYLGDEPAVACHEQAPEPGDPRREVGRAHG